MINNPNSRAMGTAETKSGSTRPHDRRVQIVRVLLESRFDQKIGLRDMGQAVSLSPWRLAHLFKSEIGVSPQRYLTLVRLQRAKDRLENGFLPVREIAVSVGIPNPSQFTRIFKAAYGMTPAQYRRAFLQVEPIYQRGNALMQESRSVTPAVARLSDPQSDRQ